jgi:N-acetylglucosamine-6-sulfatase
MLLAVDESLGRILDLLRDTRRLDRTVVIFTSDNGYFYGEHYLNEERRLAYEESIRLPLLVRWPSGAVAGTARGELVQTIDLAPTILDLAGVADTVRRDGVSLAPLLRGDSVPWRSSVLVEYWTDTVFPRVLNMGYRAVRTERYKYIQYLELEGMDELYDLETDPFELDNLMGTPRASEMLTGLKEELARLRR